MAYVPVRASDVRMYSKSLKYLERVADVMPGQPPIGPCWVVSSLTFFWYRRFWSGVPFAH